MSRFTIPRRPFIALCGVSALILIITLLLLNLESITKFWPAYTLRGPRPSSSTASNGIFVPPWNRPPKEHVPEHTPLFIGFTRNWLLLKQVVVSYITAGWPASDIYVVDDSGTMLSNINNLLTPNNPFYLDHDYLTRVLGVHVLTTPTLLTFAQLQNYFLFTSVSNGWPHFFWSHMDGVALTNETYEPFSSLYMRAVDALRETQTDPDWGMRFFAYDHLTLANVEVYTAIGGFDTFIPYYATDCDFNFRLRQSGHTIEDVVAGRIFDVGDNLADLSLLLRENTAEASATCEPEDIEAAAHTIKPSDGSPANGEPYGRGDCRYHALNRMLEALDHEKQTHKGGRNYWQTSSNGGIGEPFWQLPEGFERGLQMHMDHGRKVFNKKWAHEGCDLKKAGRTCENQETCSAWKIDEKKDHGGGGDSNR